MFFETDSSSLTADRQATLDKQAAWLNRYTNYRIMIEGHADERGTREYNIALGARRASVVVNYLVSRGVNAQRITSRSRSARNVRWRSATIFRAGHKTAVL